MGPGARPRPTPARPPPTRRPSTTSASSTPARPRCRSRSSTRAGLAAGVPREHLRRPDHRPAGQRGRRAAEVLPDREPHLPADRADRLDPGRGRPDGDEAGGLHQGRGRQRQGGLRRGPGHALELEKGMYGVTIVSNTGIDPTAGNFRSYAQTIKPRRARTASSSPASSPTAPSRSPRTSTPPSRPPRSSAATASAPAPSPQASQGGVPASIDPLIECTVATQDLAAYPGGKEFLAAYKAAYGSADPDPYAIYGYEAMELGLRHDRVARRRRQQQGRRAQGAVRHQGTAVGARHLRVRQERRHHAEVLRRCTRSAPDGEPVFFETLTPTKTVS